MSLLLSTIYIFYYYMCQKTGGVGARKLAAPPRKTSGGSFNLAWCVFKSGGYVDFNLLNRRVLANMYA